MKIAVEGCCHGELDAIYDTLEYLEKKNNITVDLLLICGDFQSVRNKADMRCMAVPPKYQKMNTFYKYYSGEKTAPVLTVFIGGNHEASNYLQELPYGGWVAPKIYYMGYANVLQFGGLRIGGISGIFKGKDYMKGHYEHPPYTEETKRSAYHMRVFDVFRLKQLQQHVDIFLSHDWPRGIYHHGNTQDLLRKKSFFRDEIERDQLGNPVAMDLLHQLQPSYWFSAHLHVKFPALVQHTEDANSKITKFLALDKCLPKRQFLQVLDIPHDTSKPLKLQLDAEWLAILKSTNSQLCLTKSNHYPGSGERSNFTPTQEELNAVISDFGGDLSIPENFEQTVPVYDPVKSKKANSMADPVTEINGQTKLLCSMLDLTDPNAVFLGKDSAMQLPSEEGLEQDEGVNDSDDDVDAYESEPSFISLTESERSFSDRSLSFLSVGNESFSSVGNPEEISVDDEREEETGSLGDVAHTLKGVGSIPKTSSLGDKSLSLEEKSSSLDEADNENDNEQFNKIMSAQQFEKKIRRSLSESLPKPKLDSSMQSSASSELNSSKNNSVSFEEDQKPDSMQYNSISSEDDPKLNLSKYSSASSEEDLGDAELAEIMAAQKKSKGTESESDASKTSMLSDTSIDCKSLDLNDKDPELLEMLQMQKEASLRKADTVNAKKLMEVSLDHGEVELQDIVPTGKQTFEEDCLDDGQTDFKNLLPTYQSSPVVSIEDRVDQNFTATDASLSQAGKSGGGVKRGEGEKTNCSPAMKKFRRRNQDLYSDNSTGDED